MSVITGGKTVYGATVGILMLETRFPRPPGDMGNAGTWPFPVHYRVVRGATPDNVVRGDPRALLDHFIEAGRDLVAMGCDGITTNCGFLALVQAELSEALAVPVATSSLMQVPQVNATLPPGQRVGVLTISAETLSPAHLRAAGIGPEVPIVGTEGGRAFTEQILGDRDTLDLSACRADMIDAANRLVNEHDGIGAIVLECTNMVPYAADVRRVTGLPVFSIYTLITWFQSALLPRRFDPNLDDVRL